MDLKAYEKYWGKLKPVALKKLTEIQSLMNDELAKVGFKFGEFTEGGDEEWTLCSVISDSNDNCKATLEFTLLDSDVNGGLPTNAVGINIDVGGFNATTLARYCPYNYSDKAFTKSIAEATRRIKGLNATEFANVAIAEFNTDELLNKEFAEHLAS